MTKREYHERMKDAGPKAMQAQRFLEELRLDLKLRRKFGQGSLKLYGFGGSSIVFQPAPDGNTTAGLRVQIRDDFPRQGRSLSVRE